MNLRIIFLILIFFFSNNNVALSNEKIAYINLDKILKNSSLGKSTLSKIKILNEKNISDLKVKENELKIFDDEINQKKNILSKEELNKEISDFKKKYQSYKTIKEKMVSEFEQMRLNELNNFFKQINPLIQKYMENNSIDILLEQKNVFIAKSNSDITAKIIEEINKNFK